MQIGTHMASLDFVQKALTRVLPAMCLDSLAVNLHMLYWEKTV